MTNIVALRAANVERWQKVKITRDCSAAAKGLVSAKPRYQAVEAKTGVPWFVIAVIHERESGQNWFANLAQGDPWSRVSVHVPAGRGPFRSWEEAATDALTDCAPYLARNRDWSIGGTLTRLEEYNGLGYAARGIPSPYLWAGTDRYTSGKYVRDGVYDASAIDSQPGCAGLLLAVMRLDRTVSFDGDMSPIAEPPAITQAAPAPRASRPPSITSPSKGSIGAFVASLITSIFNVKKRK